MDSWQPISILAGFVVAAAMLWLASETAAACEGQPSSPGNAGRVVAVLLAGCGLWWPGHVMRAAGAGAALDAVWAWLPAMAVAAAALVTGRFAGSEKKLLAIPLWLVTLMLANVHAMLATPGIFKLSHGAGVFGAGAALMALSIALVVTLMPMADWRHGRAARLAGTVASVMMVSLAAALTSNLPGRESLAVLNHLSELPMLAALACVAAVLLRVLAQPGGGTRVSDAGGRSLRAAAPDALTGLPTRLYFEAKLSEAAKKCEGKSTKLAVLFVDLDGFKPVNDTFGHSSGDRVLEQVGERLKGIARTGVLAVRVGGDEFLLLTTGISSPDAASQLAARVIETLSRPYEVDDREVGISCSIGIAMYPDGSSPGKLIARADAAMYAAKRAGGARHCFYSRDMDVDGKQNFDLLRDLRQALVRNELELFFQPKIDARSGKVTAAEALLRWHHPTLGVVMPGTFIPLAERSGLIGPLGDWVIEAACKQGRAWREKGLRMRVAINLSPYQMRQNDIVERIASALQRHRIHPSLLTCEITESAAMEDTIATQETFRRLGELGAHLSIDDFGTGYSSLSYLRQLPAEELKIDASFVKDIENSADARAVVDAVVKLSHALGLKVVAEGVENPRQQEILVEMGCDELQGYLFAKPMSARALLLWALGDRTESAAFRDSLFGETRQTTRPYVNEKPAQRAA
ncbi:EAL domain-containing protein [soil metagenome]